MNPISIVIADDDLIIRQGLKTILDLEEDFLVVATASNGVELCELADRHRPDIVLLDIQMPRMNGIEALTYLKQNFSFIKIIVLTTFVDEDFIVSAISKGVNGYMLKDIDANHLVQSIHDVMKGQFILPNDVATVLVQSINRNTNADHYVEPYSKADQIRLRERELDIARLIMQGKSNREIADTLFITEGTVRNYVSLIYTKLQVTSRRQAMTYLYNHREELGV